MSSHLFGHLQIVRLKGKMGSKLYITKIFIQKDIDEIYDYEIAPSFVKLFFMSFPDFFDEAMTTFIHLFAKYSHVLCDLCTFLY